MAGTIPGENKKLSDLLFDLTPEDDKKLQEADLLQLVNYGQLQRSVKIPGTNGRIYTIDMALLWDEDHIDVLRKTTAYATDPLLRVQLIRRLKLHKAIQKIDNNDYSNKEDPAAQRQLWTMLNKLSDRQIEQLDALYKQIELERDVVFFAAMKELTKTLDSTAPADIRRKTDEEKAAQASKASDHEALFEAETQRREGVAGAVQDVIIQAVEGKAESKTAETPAKIVSPKQGK